MADGATAPRAAGIASAHPLATQAGHETLAAGGNAFDAAITVAAALAVVEPYSSGLGGGGFMLLHRARDGFETMLDARERAPAGATKDMYLNDQGEAVARRSLDGPLAAGIPGMPAALDHLAKRYGNLPLARSLAPAIRLAKGGFKVSGRYHRLARFRKDALKDSPAAAAIFLNNGEPIAAGTRLRQPRLARTLQKIASQGRAGFYRGELAAKLAEGVRQAGGIWTRADLEDYRVVERKPIRGNYHGMKITSAAPPSSGGVVLVEMLNVLSGYDLDELPDFVRKHLIIEAMRRAYRDRAQYLGDPDYIDMPLARLISPRYAAGLRAGIRPDRATPSDMLAGIGPTHNKAKDTTHFSILDEAGNRVAATLSINYPFGSAFVAPGTGVLLNDEMDDFAAKPDSPNVYGLVGGAANRIEAGKRMLSSMTPTFLQDQDRLAILGTPGGSRIITMLLLSTLDFADGGDAQSMVSLPRFHHQYLPDQVQFEPEAFDDAVAAKLKAMGHSLKPAGRRYGNMQAVLMDLTSGKISAASDPRGIGLAKVEPHGTND